jgi:benzoate-CoA ligase
MVGRSPPPAQFNFAQHLIERNRQNPGKIAYIDDQEVLKYGELAERIRRMG